MIIADINSSVDGAKDNQFVFVNFYADWCRFSNLLAPVWDEGADLISKELAGQKVGKYELTTWSSSISSRKKVTPRPAQSRLLDLH